MSTNNERAVRRLAARNGYRVHKIRNGVGYELYDHSINALVLGDRSGVGYGVELTEIEGWLKG